MTSLDSLRSDAARRIEDAVAHWADIFGGSPPDDLAARRDRALAGVAAALDEDGIEAVIVAEGLGVL